MILLATFIANMLKCIKKILDIKFLIELYCKFLNYFNIIYTIIQITLISKFWDLNFFILDISIVNTIKKIIIFIKRIFKAINIEKYLRS